MHSHDQQPAELEHLRPKPSRPYDRSGSAASHASGPGTVDHTADMPGVAGAATRPGVLGREGLLRLQRAAGNAGASALFEEQSPVVDVVSGGGGQALDPPVRAEMEARLGHSFGEVRVHTGADADHSARSVQAHAYTVGSHVVFQRGQYDPTSAAGKTLLAHELTHVVQQRNGPVDGTPAAGGVRVSDPSDRFEREAAANAERVMADPAGRAGQTSEASQALVGQADSAPATAALAGHDYGGGAVQRQADEEEPEEPTAQGAFVQREADEAEEELEA
jgi:hypothetical protein